MGIARDPLRLRIQLTPAIHNELILVMPMAEGDLNHPRAISLACHGVG